jgi:Domain of unknown function (DUF4252)
MQSKSLIISLLAIIFSLNTLFAQRAVNAIFREHKHEGKGRVHFFVPGAIFKIGSIFGRNRVERRLIRSIGTTRFLMIEEGSKVTSEEINNMIRRAEKSGLEPLIEVKDGSKTHLAVSVKEKRGKIRRIFLTVRDDDEFVLIRMKCRVRYEDLGKIIEKATIKTGKKIPALPKIESPQV